MTTPPDAAQALRDIREQWGDLLAAIDRPPAAEWPPRDSRALGAEPEPTAPAVGRLPLTLREHPAPLNLTALDAALSIEAALFHLADQIAAAHQRPMRHVPVPAIGPRPLWITDPADRADPDRWHTATVRDIGRASAAAPGSRALGLHWCAVWIEDRLTQTEPTELHTPMRGVLAEYAAEVVTEAARILTAALGRDDRATRLPDPCPWCHGELTARTLSGDPWQATVTCATGPMCTAPAPYDDRARRVWRGGDLGGLYAALMRARAAA